MIDAGVHVVVDKPFMPSAAIAREVAAAGRSRDVLVTVFQNRPWDADIRTLAAILEGGRLGEPWRVVSRFDQDDARSIRVGPGNGLLLDLGTHLVDQMTWLFGPVVSVTAHLSCVDLQEGTTDGAFALDLVHAGGVTSYVESTSQTPSSPAAGPHTTPIAGATNGPSSGAILTTSSGAERVPSAQGRWHDFYSQFAAAVAGHGPLPVSLSEAIHTLEVIEAARQSASTGRSVDVTS